jgi:GNAT superfamily N-acetyltransferase
LTVHGARLATRADLPDVVELARAAVDELTTQRGGDLWARTVGRRPPLGPGLARSIDDPAQLVVCGTLDSAVVGYAVARVDALADGSRLVTVDDLFTLPDARHVGVGEVMMELVLDWSRAEGAAGIDALALPGMRDTKNFFERFGLVARAIVVHRSL